MALSRHNEAGEFLASAQGLRLLGTDHSLKAAAVDVMASAVRLSSHPGHLLIGGTYDAPARA